jgi:asparagine synthase (glutamine-hydrolysing)
MCGICGWIGDRPIRDDELSIFERMNSVLKHRGPDESGSVAFRKAALAMCRLSIIDLVSGQQPMANEDETYWIVHNGEIYNFLELRRQLEDRGHHFRTRSDTEVILRSYEEWGEECVLYLRGMFAFAIYDLTSGANGTDGRLFVARDRIGKKPLYYYRDAHRFIFGSEIKAILAHPAVPRQVNRRIVPLYLAHGYVPAPHTIFESIYELPPGHVLSVQDGEVKIQEYWDAQYPSPINHGLSEVESIERLKTLLDEAVRVRLISDVPLGAFLSGGLDSTSVVARMVRLIGRPVKTFAIGFKDDPSFNELEYARFAAHALNTDHHEFVVCPDAINLLPKLVWHYDQPFADSSAIPTYLVSMYAREHVTVALTGDGGDELFAGYERFLAAKLAESYNRSPHFIKNSLNELFRIVPESTKYGGFVSRARRFVENAPLPLAQRYLGWVGIFDARFIREFLSEEPAVDPSFHFQGYFQAAQNVDPLGQLLYVNLKTYLPGDLLVKTDRMSMANSLEARCPLLDQELLDLAAHIPSSLKLRGLTTKYILRETMRGLVPRKIIKRKKHGFGVPVGHWFRTDLKRYVQEVLLSSQALGRGYFRKRLLRKLIDEHQNGKRDNGHHLWTLLTFEIWHRIFIDQDITV